MTITKLEAIISIYSFHKVLTSHNSHTTPKQLVENPIDNSTITSVLVNRQLLIQLIDN